MGQDFWGSSGYSRLATRGDRLVATDAWLARLLEREELMPPPEAGPNERALHARLVHDVRSSVPAALVEAIEDRDAVDNWRTFLAFRDRVLAHATLEEAYVDLFRAPAVDIAPDLVDVLTQAITRATLEGVDDPFVLRAGEMMFRRQRVAAEGGQMLAADAATLEAFARTGEAKIAVMSGENAPFYWLRDELYSFALDLTPGREGARALADVLERWIARLARLRVRIEPVARIDDERWRWHVGLDAESTSILNALYRGEEVAAEALERLVALFRLDFAEMQDVREDVRGRPVYLALAVRPDRTLKLKPQNLLVNLPFSGRVAAALGVESRA
jgi:hypothetical protein